jgi:two-component system, NtrC family, response regulator AlgB
MIFPTVSALHVLIVDDDVNVRKTLSISLETDGHQVVAVSNSVDAVLEAARNHFDVAFVDLKLRTESGLDLISLLRAQSPWLQTVIITAFGTIDIAVETMKRGAVDFLPKPFTPAQVKHITDPIAQQVSRAHQAHGQKGDRGTQRIFESASPVMQRVLSLARQVANSDVTILLRGESGTGKGVVARAIHELSPRAAKSFTTVSCPSLSAQLLESELFGHVKGAFTGAVRDNPGRIASSNEGTLFLDEIGDLPLELQPKLLRFVQERHYERVGEAVVRHADVRLIAATNVNLEDAVHAGRFREDLLYRIKVIQIDVPPLRQRPEDIIPLAEHFVAVLQNERTIVGFTDEARSAMLSYSWPGNVRELRNVVERAIVLCTSKSIGLEHFPGNFMPSSDTTVELGDPVPVSKLEELHIRRVLSHTKSLEEAARILEMDPATLWRRRKKYGI